MLVVDRLLISGIRWVLDKVVQAVDRELNDDEVLKERLLEAQMRAELGELSEEELHEIETDVMARLREIAERRGQGAFVMDPTATKVTGIEASFVSDETEELD